MLTWAKKGHGAAVRSAGLVAGVGVSTIGADAAVTGAIECEDVRVYGTVKGDIRARSVFVAASARVSGDIVHETISVESGAYIEGLLKRLDTSDSKIAVVGASKKSGERSTAQRRADAATDTAID